MKTTKNEQSKCLNDICKSVNLPEGSPLSDIAWRVEFLRIQHDSLNIQAKWLTNQLNTLLEIRDVDDVLKLQKEIIRLKIRNSTLCL